MGKMRAAAILLLLTGISSPRALEARQILEGRHPLQPPSRVDRVIAPFMEGYYLNDDGSVTYSFGYMNLNDATVEIPIGDGNRIEPAELAGMQPTVFLPGRHRGMFAITVPPAMAQTDVWWTITNPNGRVTRVPGRTSWSAYRLDWRPRAHGTVPPRVTFEGGQEPIGIGLGPAGVMAARPITTSVGAPTTLTVMVKDLSVRAPTETDPQLVGRPTPLRVVWTVHQAPVGAAVEFSRHESTPMPEDSATTPGGGTGGGTRCDPQRGPCAELDEDQVVAVPSGDATVRVLAAFQTPGEYLMNVQVDNWGLPDSGAGDQCCWTNGYVRVTVTP